MKMPSSSPLWPHQIEAERFVDGKSAAMLAMVMRSGKSRVTVEVLEERQARRTLLLCPSSVVNVWPDQFEQYGHSSTRVLTLPKGVPLPKRTQMTADFLNHPSAKQARNNVVVINYEAFYLKAFIDRALPYKWDALVMDESHRLKSPSGRQSRAAARLAYGKMPAGVQVGYPIPQKIPFLLALTGTPMAHGPLDIYGQYRVLDPSIFGTNFAQFRNTYADVTMAPGFPKINGYRNLDRLREKFYSIAFEVGPEVLNLPAPLHISRYFEMTGEGRRVYESLEKDFYAEVEAGEITASNAMVKALRLQQCTSGFARLADSDRGDEVEVDTGKRELLADILEDLDEPVVVFCRFRHDLDVVHRAAQGTARSSLELSGRRNDLQDWQNGGAPILAVQTQAGGVGIDLSRAKIAIYYSLGLSLGDHLQSLSRLQKRDMGYSPAYYFLLAQNSVDQKVFRALEARKEVIDEVMKR